MTEARDPRHLNTRFDLSSIAAYRAGYADALHAALASIDAAALERACALIEDAADRGSHILAIGNGGSAAIADHLCCDWTKGTHVPHRPAIDSRSLVSNVALYSAIANDFGFEHVFARQIEMTGKAGDVLVAISSSGNSANILAASEAARARGIPVIGLTGFDGGRLRATADVALHADAANYGIVEDCHQSLIHILAQFIAARRDAVA